jgi:uncharacterized membrane protein
MTDLDTLRRYALAIVFNAAGFAVSGVLWCLLPELLPAHFDAHGVADRFVPKDESAFLLPVLGALLVAVLIALEPRGLSEPESGSQARVYAQVVAAIAGLQLLQTVIKLMTGMGVPLDVPVWSTTGLGVAVMVIGNSFGKLTRNSIIGIRTRWTLASDEVWARTHRLGGWLFVMAGLLMCVTAALGYPRLSTIPLAAAAGVSCLYAGQAGRQHGGGRSR